MHALFVFCAVPFEGANGGDFLTVSSVATSGPQFIGSISNITIPFYGSKYDTFYVSSVFWGEGGGGLI